MSRLDDGTISASDDVLASPRLPVGSHPCLLRSLKLSAYDLAHDHVQRMLTSDSRMGSNSDAGALGERWFFELWVTYIAALYAIIYHLLTPTVIKFDTSTNLPVRFRLHAAVAMPSNSG